MKHYLIAILIACCSLSYAQEVPDSVFNINVLDRIPIFPGCNENGTKEESLECMNQLISRHVLNTFEYPSKARSKNIEGKVFVNFVVSKTGEIEQIQVVRRVHPLLDKEAVRIVSLLPNALLPALLNDKAVPVSFTVPINFKLDSSNKKQMKGASL